MAKTPVTLQVADYVDREVLEVSYDFNQATDKEGQLAGIPRGGYVNIRVKALNDGNNQLLQWMLAGSLAKDVKIKFEKTTDGSDMKTIECTGCYCVDYHECWEEGQQHYEEIRIACQNITNGPVKFENEWA